MTVDFTIEQLSTLLQGYLVEINEEQLKSSIKELENGLPPPLVGNGG